MSIFLMLYTLMLLLKTGNGYFVNNDVLVQKKNGNGWLFTYLYNVEITSMENDAVYIADLSDKTRKLSQ